MSFNNEDFTESEETTETLSFYDRAKQQSLDPQPQVSTDFYSQAKAKETETESLSFYDQAKQSQQDSEGLFAKAGRKIKDILTPKSSKEPFDLVAPYRPEEKTPEEIKNMTLKERRQYAKDLEVYKEVAIARGLPRGLASGLTFEQSERIPGFKPSEEDLLFGSGQLIGGTIPYIVFKKFVANPAVATALKPLYKEIVTSPIGKKALGALGDITAWGLTAAGVEAADELAHGEIPSPKELAKEGGTWMMIDAFLKSIRGGYFFSKMLKETAKFEEVSRKTVLKRWWGEAKTQVKSRRDRLKALYKKAQDAEQALYDKAPEIKVTPVEEGKKPSPKETEKPIEDLIVEEEPTKKPKQPLKEPEKPVEKTKEVVKEKKPSVAISKEEELTKRIAELKISTDAVEATGVDTIRNAPDGYLEELQELNAKNLELEELQEKKKYGVTRKEYLKIASEAIPKTVKPDEPVTIYRGYGRKDKRSVYGSVDEPVLGAGKYYAFDPITAAQFGPNIEKKTIAFKNPLVIDNDVEWRKFTKEVGLKFPNILNVRDREETLKNIQKLNDFIRQQEYDAVVVKWPLYREDDRAKTLSKVFGEPQVFIPASAKKQVSAVDFARQPRFEVQKQPKQEPARSEKKPKEEPARGKIQPIATKAREPIKGTKQAARRSDIIKLFQKAFKDPLRIGKISRRYLGIHKGWPKVSRLLHANDIETAAHEIGHNLHYTMYGGDSPPNAATQRANVVKHLRPYLNELKPLALYDPYTLEGFAEFTRLYVTNAEAAKALAPKFYKKFEKDLDANFPDLKKALLEARQYYDDYLEGTPQSRIESQITYGGDESKFNKFLNTVRDGTLTDSIETDWLDRVFPAKRLISEAFGIPLHEVEDLKSDANLYRTLRLLAGAVGKVETFLEHQAFNPLTLEKIGESYREILIDLPNMQTIKEFDDFLVARRTIEKTAQNIDTGINIEDAIQVHKDLKGKYGEIAQRYDKYADNLLKYSVYTELLSWDQYREIKKNNLFYAPFFRDMVDRIGLPKTGKGVQATIPIKRMKGSTRNILSPTESMLHLSYSIILNGEKNLAGLVLSKVANFKNIGRYVERVRTPIQLKAKLSKEEILKQIERNLQKQGVFGSEGFVKSLEIFGTELEKILPDFFLRFGAGRYPPGENIITVFVKGKPKYYEVTPEIYDMWTKGMSSMASNVLVKVLRQPARMLRAGAILTPRFAQKNFIRDFFGGLLFSRYGSLKHPITFFIDSFYLPLSMIAESIRKGPIFVEWLKSGGGMATMQSVGRNEIEGTLEDIRRGRKKFTPLGLLRALGQVLEEANRLAEFVRGMKAEGKTKLGKEIAAFASRDLSVDFLKGGLKAMAVNRITAFFNVGIQGMNKFYRTLRTPKTRAAFIARFISTLMIPSLILAWIYKDDEEIQDLPDYERDFNFIYRNKNGTIIKIPVTFEPGVVGHGFTQRMFRYMMKDDPHAFDGLMQSIWTAGLPNLMPTILTAPIEAEANKSFFTGAPIIPRGKERLASRLQTKEYTSLVARRTGRLVNYILGDDTTSKAASPAIIDHYINAWTGGLGRAVIEAADIGLEKIGLGDKIPKPKRPIAERLGFDAFTVRYPKSNTKSIQKFYELYQDMDSRKKSLKHEKDRKLITSQQYRAGQQRITRLYNVKMLEKGYKAIQKAQKAINGIMKNPKITSEEKREMIDKMYLQMTFFARKAVSVTHQHQRDKKVR